MGRSVRSVVAVLALAGCQGSGEAVPADVQTPVAVDAPSGPAHARLREHPNVVIVTLDTTRADHIGAYGDKTANTPNLDALAAAGRRYAHTYSPIPLTIPAHAALFTGLYPPHTGIRDNGGAVLPASAVTLAERLHDVGYATGASVGAFVTTRAWGLSQGFDAYYDDIRTTKGNYWYASRSADKVVDDALTWRAAQDPDQSQLLWVHLYDAHFPAHPPGAFTEKASGKPYDGAIAYMDDQLGRLIGAYRNSPTVFVVVADHGESLGEHHELHHGLFAYEATQRVPLVISGPGVTASVVDAPTSLVDVTPTLLALLGLPAPEGLDGRPVPGSDPRPLYVETYQLMSRFGLSPHLGVVDGSHALLSMPRPELYDVSTDPEEVHDLASTDPATVARLKAELEAFGFSPPAPSTGPVDPEVAAQLQAMGYATTTYAGSTDGPRPDPKDAVPMLEQTQAAEEDLETGHVEAAEKSLGTLRIAHPDVTEFIVRDAMALSTLGRHDQATSVLAAAVARWPAIGRAHV